MTRETNWDPHPDGRRRGRDASLSPREQKVVDVARLAHLFSRSAVVLVAHYKGLGVRDMQTLRSEACRVNAGVLVAKNTLARIAIKNTAYEGLGDLLIGPNCFIYSNDPVETSKIAVEFSGSHPHFHLTGGALGRVALQTNDVRKLATLPSLDVARARLVALLVEPATRLSRLAAAPAVRLARLADRYSEGMLERHVPPTTPVEKGRSIDGELDEPKTPTMIVRELNSKEASRRLAGAREASRFLRSMGDEARMETRRAISGREAFEATTLADRLYEGIFCGNPEEARQSAYALVTSTAKHRGLLDPETDLSVLSAAQLEEFRVALRRLFYDANLFYFSQVEAVRTSAAAEEARLDVTVRISRRVPFTIGDKDVLLEERRAPWDVVHIGCPLASSIEDIPVGERPSDEAMVAMGRAEVTLMAHWRQGDPVPIVVSYGRAVETIDVMVPA